MMILNFFAVLFLFVLVNTEEDLLKPCAVEDIECLNQSTEKFLEKTSGGIPEYDIKRIDPAFIPEMNINSPDKKLSYHFTNISVTGLKNQRISDFKMDLEKKSVILSTKVNLNIVSDVSASIKELKYSGIFSGTAEVLGTMQYNYSLEKDANNVEHFVVGPETISCDVIGNPTVELKPKPSDEIYKNVPKEIILTLRKQTLCKLVKILFADVVHNIRAAAKLLPKSAFFTNV